MRHCISLVLGSLVGLATACAGGLATTLALVLALDVDARAQLLFGPSQVTAITPFGNSLRCDAGDVNGDGFADLVKTLGGALSVHFGDGAGHFTTAGVAVPDMAGTEVRLADLDGDGREDLLTGSAATASLRVALADGAGGFLPPVTLALGAVGISGLGIECGDADGDADLDVLVITRGSGPGSAGEARLFLNDGAGQLAAGPVYFGDATHIVSSGIPAALDADGLPDLVVVTTDVGVPTTTALLGRPAGGLVPSWTASGVRVSRVADLDADGDLDLVAVTSAPFSLAFVSTFLGTGEGSFVKGPVTDMPPVLFGVASVDVADFDADGFPDLLHVPGVPEAWVLRGDGTGGFSLPGARVTLTDGIDPTFAQTGPLADYDGDGRLDVAAILFPPFQAQPAVSLNRTYAAGGPLLDLGGQLKGSHGYPIQLVTGSFAGGTPFAFSLSNGPSSGLVLHVLGFSVINVPFKGGTMVPLPSVFSGPWSTTAGGTLVLAGDWPTGVPSGLELALQFWFASTGTVAGYAASSGVVVTMP